MKDSTKKSASGRPPKARTNGNGKKPRVRFDLDDEVELNRYKKAARLDGQVQLAAWVRGLCASRIQQLLGAHS